MHKFRLSLEEETLYILHSATSQTSEVSPAPGLPMLLYSSWVKTEYVASVSWHAGTLRNRIDRHGNGMSALKEELQLKGLP